MQRCRGPILYRLYELANTEQDVETVEKQLTLATLSKWFAMCHLMVLLSFLDVLSSDQP